MQTCKTCGAEKPATDFYQYDGRPMSTCKECVKFKVRANRAANIDRYREYDRQRAFRPDRVAARKAYQEQVKRDPVKAAEGGKTSKAWRVRNPPKRNAQIAAGNAVRDGRLEKQPCVRCGATERIQAHHEDYSKPLDVMWLCRPCHGIRHREINAERRKAG